MTWSLELIRDGFCVGLGFWLAYGFCNAAWMYACWIWAERKKVAAQNKQQLKRQIDER